MRLAVLALSLATLCAPGIALAQNGTTAPTVATPPPTADCTTMDCNTSRNQHNHLNNGAGTPGAQDSLDNRSGGNSNSSGSGTLKPTTPDNSLGGQDDGLSGGNDNGGLSGSGSLGGSSSGGGL